MEATFQYEVKIVLSSHISTYLSFPELLFKRWVSGHCCRGHDGWTALTFHEEIVYAINLPSICRKIWWESSGRLRNEQLTLFFGSSLMTQSNSSCSQKTQREHESERAKPCRGHRAVSRNKKSTICHQENSLKISEHFSSLRYI